jgi:hypothetical protein
LEIPVELSDQLREHCRRIGASITDEVRLAIRRHLAYPPPTDAPPPMLPDAAPRPRRPAKRKKG